MVQYQLPKMCDRSKESVKTAESERTYTLLPGDWGRVFERFEKGNVIILCLGQQK